MQKVKTDAGKMTAKLCHDRVNKFFIIPASQKVHQIILGQKAEDDIFLYFGDCPGSQLSVILNIVHLHFLHTGVIFIQSQVFDGVED